MYIVLLPKSLHRVEENSASRQSRASLIIELVYIGTIIQ